MNFKKRMRILLLVLLTLSDVTLTSGETAAPIETITTPGDNKKDNSDKMTFTPSLYYGNERIRSGKVQSTNSGYVQPSVTYRAKKGFTWRVNSNYYFSQSAIDEFDLMLGYDFKFSENTSGGISLTKYFYTASSIQSGSSVTGNFNFYVKHKFSWLVSELDFDLDVLNNKLKKKESSSSDYTFTWTNYHSFNFTEVLSPNNELDIAPTVLLSAGTQNSYILYFQKNSKKYPNIDLTSETSKASKLNFTSVEFELPVAYYISDFKIEPALHYYMPQNQSKLIATSNLFYFTMELSYEF